ncbi:MULTISPECIES: hypothetical protein [Haloferax]|uniref:Uncharacterized protein n=1 Tax=Haloferax mediterranei (strain ATCC 33500 / DSM 1411 / JCM 8866 / NBRC 14739 / NCIMB 2177 / R-4) TaxID=523841 RepID=I3R579_HALMT|nr:hypothetical protein [Haloferax mediterranei]AFK19389.1 hypothetical protein HFX_1683 [Haloferax mediterranei ATCC 33500]MDX5989492.1 hypothetical protein [Haloferax mediterranei ATCC 33500]
MTTSAQSHSETTSDQEPQQGPEIAICESRPGKSVFLEAGNTDGWISSDMTVDVIR